MCIDLLEYQSDDELLHTYQKTSEYYETAKQNGDIPSAEFWASELARIEKELAERGLMTETS